MKNYKLSLTLLLLISSFAFTGCDKSPINEISTTKQILQQGTWSISYYFAGQDNTAQYHGYQFNFMASGALQVINGSDTVMGTWNNTKDENFKDVISFDFENGPQSFSSLNTKWSVQTAGLNQVSFKDSVSTQLIFSKL